MCLGADCSSIHLASTQYHLWTLDFHQIPLHHWSALHAEQQCITGRDKYFDLGKLLLGLIITLTSTVLNLFSFKGKETLRSQGRPFNCLDKKNIIFNRKAKFHFDTVPSVLRITKNSLS